MCANSNHLWPRRQADRSRPGNNISGRNSPGNLSIEDNTEYVPLPGDSGQIHLGGKKPQRQKSLSMVKPVLEEILKKIESLESRLKRSVQIETADTKSKAPIRIDSNTDAKVPYTKDNSVASSTNCGAASNSNDNVISRPLQIGNGNFMVFCENVESRSERTCRQIGDKNVIINVNSCCNKCQIMDHANNQVVPVDSEGEIWLEIKRRSFTDSSQTSASHAHHNIPSPPIDVHRDRFNDLSTNIPREGLNDLSRCNSSQSSVKYTKHARVPLRERRVPVQHTDQSTCDFDEYTSDNSNMAEGYDEDQHHIYDRIIEHPGGKLSVKIPIPSENEDSSDFTRQHLDRFLADESVNQYLSKGGGDFELSVCTWSYEKEEVYTTVKNPPCQMTDGLYSKVLKPPMEVAPPPPKSPGVDGRKWFKETMDKRMAHEHLKNKKNGAFLVRKATQPDQKHRYTIEFIDEEKIRRLKILNSEDGYHFEYSENKTFDSLDELVRAIRKAGLEIKEESGRWKTIKVFPV